MGRMPAAAAPMPAPVKPDSDSGVSRMRSSPNSVHQPLRHRVAAAIGAHVLAHQEHAVVADHRVADRLFHRLAIGHLDGLRRGVRRAGGSAAPQDVVRQGLHRLPRAGLGEGHGLGDLGVDAASIASTSSWWIRPFSRSQPWKRTMGPLPRHVRDLVLVAVELGVEHRMGAEAVGVAFEEMRPPVSRMRAMARRAAASTATTSMPSTRSASMP
jgi:hypothetical protein